MMQRKVLARGGAVTLSLALISSMAAACSPAETEVEAETLPSASAAPDIVSFDLQAEVLDSGEQIVSVSLDTSQYPDIEPSSVDADTFTVSVTSASPIDDLQGRELTNIYDGERTVTGAEVEDGQIILNLESGFEVEGASTLGALSLGDGTSRTVLMNQEYTVAQTKPFVAADNEVTIEGFGQGDLVSPEVDAFASAVSAEGLNYRLFTPEMDDDSSPALVIFLHGNGEGGVDADEYNNESPLRANRGVLAYSTSEAQEALGGAYVVGPQVPGTWYDDPDEDYSGKLAGLVDEVLSEHSDIDPDRVYVAGLSAGGYMGIRFAGAYPDEVAAVVAIAPALWLYRNDAYNVVDEDILKIAELPTWLIHARNDDVVDYEKASAWAYDLLSPSGNVEFTSYDNVVWDGVEYSGHESWVPASRNDPALDDGTHLWEWLGQQSK